MELYEILGSLEFILSFMAMLLSSFVFWKTSLAGLRTSKLLQGFNLVRVLKRTDTELALLGDFNDDKIKEKAVLIIQTAAMDTGALDQLLAGLSLHEILVNDIYRTFQGDVPRDIKPYKVNLIYPATESHILKHTEQNFHMVVETKEIYQTITKPFIDSVPSEKIEWIYNILDHKSESERIIYEDTDLSRYPGCFRKGKFINEEKKTGTWPRKAAPSPCLEYADVSACQRPLKSRAACHQAF
ncbi:hypothetical protein DVH05_013800 [Phytophthora capsici]|nr:hypothetical protein DVH05_013800 [Phytophthora capsici]